MKILVKAGAGDDNVTIDSSVTDPATVSGGSGNDTLITGSGDDNVDAGTGDDTVETGAGNDHVTGGKGHDSIDCGAGNDQVDLPKGGGVTLAQVPTAVQAGLTTLANGAPITAVQTFTEDGQTFYATLITVAGKPTRIAVDASGNPVTDTQEGKGGGVHDSNHQNHTFGALVSVDAGANTITIALSSEHGAGTQTTFTLGSGAAVTVDGAPSDLGSLPAGIWVGIETDPANPNVATSIAAKGRRGEGTVSAIDMTAGTITVAGEENATPQTFNVPSTAKIEINGVAGTLAGVTLGSKVEFQLSALDPQAITSLETGSAGGDGGSSGGGDHNGAGGTDGATGGSGGTGGTGGGTGDLGGDGGGGLDGGHHGPSHA